LIITAGSDVAVSVSWFVVDGRQHKSDANNCLVLKQCHALPGIKIMEAIKKLGRELIANY